MGQFKSITASFNRVINLSFKKSQGKTLCTRILLISKVNCMYVSFLIFDKKMSYEQANKYPLMHSCNSV